MSAHRTPVSTFRLQLSAHFTFDDAAAVLPYLQQLGISDLYCSPILKAVRGSTHGYDVVDPTVINPELGGEDGLARLSDALRRRGMGLLVDIVPNHLAVSHDNPAWMDALEHGGGSPFARWFDLNWPAGTAADRTEPIRVPVLGDALAHTLERGEISLVLDEGSFAVAYFDWRFPLDVRNWGELLVEAASRLERQRSRGDIARRCGDLAKRASNVPRWDDSAAAATSTRRALTAAIRRELAELSRDCEACRRALEETVKAFNATWKGDASRWRTLLEQQAYRPVFWQRAFTHVCYRRFFDVTHLIGVRVEDPDVFHATHERIIDLARAGIITGLRIDHIDGLAEPRAYLQRLQRAISGSDSTSFHIVVEKILEGDEALDPAWPVCGTTGYEFLNALAGVFIEPEGFHKLAAFHVAHGGSRRPFAMNLPNIKREVAEALFTGEIEALTQLLLRCAPKTDIPPEVLSPALVHLSAHLPVYRTYISSDDLRRDEIQGRDRTLIEHATAAAMRTVEPAAREAVATIRDILLENGEPETSSDRTRFALAWQQFTGPLMAKGLEDTGLYRDARLVALNEVGVSPEHIDSPSTVAAFHGRNRTVAASALHPMNATTTHDTKRSEDVRARLYALTEFPEAWCDAVRRWHSMNSAHRTEIDCETVPDARTESFLYQCLLGVWPLTDLESADLPARMSDYMVKAAREAKEQTSWLDVNEPYENALVSFVRDILDPAKSNVFLNDLEMFLSPLAWQGALNSIAQALLKIASPGSPDVYQGTELWDFSLVDPDNRRPVDYDLRRSALDLIASSDETDGLIDELLSTWRDGRLKLFIVYRALCCRREHRLLFETADYRPLRAHGEHASHVVAFSLRREDTWLVVAAAVRTGSLAPPAQLPIDVSVWKETAIALPPDVPQQWRDAFTGKWRSAEPVGDGLSLPLARVFQSLPIAMLVGQSGG